MLYECSSVAEGLFRQREQITMHERMRAHIDYSKCIHLLFHFIRYRPLHQSFAIALAIGRSIWSMEHGAWSMEHGARSQEFSQAIPLSETNASVEKRRRRSSHQLRQARVGYCTNQNRRSLAHCNSCLSCDTLSS